MSGCLPADLKSLAIVLPSWIGDTVMATPVLRAIRKTLPKTNLIGIVRPGLDEILCGSPWLDEISVCQMNSASGPFRVAKAIRSHQVQAVILFPNSFRSALSARLSGAPIRIGYRRDARSLLLTHSLKPRTTNLPISAVDYYAELGEFALGCKITNRHLELGITTEEKDEAETILKEVQRPFVLLNPGAIRKDKRWPAERFAKVAEELQNSHGLTPVLTGSPAERDLLDAVNQYANTSILDLSKKDLQLGTLKLVIREAALMITNDTGPRHMAIALGTPVVSLFGPTDYRWTAIPDANEHVVQAEPFLPEKYVADDYPKVCAIDRISVSDVITAAERMLNCN